MKDFEEFRLEVFNNILPLVKEVVDVFWEIRTSLSPTLEKYNKKLKELNEEKEAFEKICAINGDFSENTKLEIYERLKKKVKEITATEKLIEEKKNKINDFECLIQQYYNYLRGIGLGISKNNGKILEKAEDVNVEYLREYFFLMFCFNSKYCCGFSREYMLSKEAMEYICKYLVENEEEDIANKKIAVLRGEQTLYQKDFLELFK